MTEVRVPITTSMFGLATVHPSHDPSFPKFACVFPGNKKTRWFSTRAGAHRAANKFNRASK